MPKEFSESEAALHNRLFQEACALLQGELHMQDQPAPRPPSLRTRLKLKRAYALLERVLSINRENAAATFYLARIRLRLDDRRGALNHLLKAHEMEPLNPAFARETVLVATQLDQFDLAIDVGRLALQRMPDDAGLLVNLGLALLFADRATDAESVFRNAAELEPGNATTSKLVAYAGLVSTRGAPHPRQMRDILAAIDSL